MDRMAILAKTQKWHKGKSEKGGGLQQPPLLRERVKVPSTISDMLRHIIVLSCIFEYR